MRHVLLGLALFACGSHEAPAPVVIVAPPPVASTSAAPVVVAPAPPPPAPPFDLENAKLVGIGASPAKPAAPKPIGVMPIAKKLHELSRKKDPSADQRFLRRDAPYDPTHPTTAHQDGVLPDGAPSGIPSHFRSRYANYISTSGGKLLIGYGTIYGARYLAVVTGDKVDEVIDFFPPALSLGREETASSDLLDTIYESGILYACRGYNHPDRSRKGYITAIEATTGEMHWRSAAQTCGGSLALFGDYIVTGYGEDVMPYQTHLLRKYDGATVQSFRNDGAMLESSMQDDKLVVGTYKHRITYDLR